MSRFLFFFAIAGFLMACVDQSLKTSNNTTEWQSMSVTEPAAHKAEDAQKLQVRAIRILTPVQLLKNPNSQSPAISPDLPAGFAIAELLEEQNDWLKVCIHVNSSKSCGYILKENTNWSP